MRSYFDLTCTSKKNNNNKKNNHLKDNDHFAFSSRREVYFPLILADMALTREKQKTVAMEATS